MGAAPGTALSMGMFDFFSEDAKKQREAEKQARIDAADLAQQRIVERRRNPDKMDAYQADVRAKRKELTEEKAVYDFQRYEGADYDPLTDWEKLREEGKIIIGDDLERDKSTERLGSEGLQEVRVDERMPYIERGYVDEDADVVGNIMKIFGGGKKDDDKKPKQEDIYED